MPRPRGAARPAKVSSKPSKIPQSLGSPVIVVGFDDYIPPDFIEGLRLFPKSDEHESHDYKSERPSKRARTDTVDAITIGKGSLLVSRPRDPDLVPVADGIVRDDVGRYLAFDITSSNVVDRLKGTQELGIYLRRRQHHMPTKVNFLLKEPVGPEFVALIHTAGQIFSNTEENDIWCNASIRISHLNNRTHLKIAFELNWNGTNSFFRLRPRKDRKLGREVIEAFLPQCDTSEVLTEPWSPQDFYGAAHVPPKDSIVSGLDAVEGLEANLFPFQQRTVKWMLEREGAGDESERTRAPSTVELPLSFVETTDVDGSTIYVSSLYQIVTRDIKPFVDFESSVRGGILAEEMGLGKTLECLALILQHPRVIDEVTVFDPYFGQKLRKAGTTLIVTPGTLKDQWLSEITRHAPQLSVMYYAGRNAGRKSQMTEDDEETLIAQLISCDVVVTTYTVLSAEIHYAMTPPERSMRSEKKYQFSKSPLVLISWWRVCLDEAQMIESGVTNAAIVARAIPRVNAWSITGTPVKKDVKDLWGLLLFLRYEPFASYQHIWDELASSYKQTFRQLFNTSSLRHTKRLVRDEIALPRQQRYVITMPFSAVEEQHYQTLFQQLARSCGLDTSGSPLSEDWNPEEGALEAMRIALDRLRQTALHPEVGVQNRRAFGHKVGSLRTVEEVLDAMLDQSESVIRAEQRALFNNLLTQGQLLENSPRVKEALAIWERVRDDARVVVAECREQLRIELARSREKNGKGKEIASEEDDSDDSEDSDESVLGKRVGECRRKLRLALEIEHKATFFCANGYFQVKSNKDFTELDSDEFHRLEKTEVEGYDLAKRLRKEILHETHEKAMALLGKISGMARAQKFAVIPAMKYIHHKGIESRPILERLDELSSLLDAQANQLDEWREHAIRLLLKPLVDEEKDAEITGEEYEDSTKIQEELVVYVQALRTAIADRQDAFSGQINELVKHETRISLNMAKNGEGPSPEKLISLMQRRDDVKADPVKHGSLRRIVSELRMLASKLRPDANTGNARAKNELLIVLDQLKLAQAQLSGQNKVATVLEQEVDRFTNAMNARVEYYRQLQYVSDTVAPYEGPNNEIMRENLLNEEATLRKKVDAAEAKHRYLVHLKDSGSSSGEPNLCVICRESFTVGVLTVCGHQFCKECLMLWFRTHHNCPVCKRHLHMSNLHDITLKPQAMKVHQENAAAGPSQSSNNARLSRSSAIYSEFSSEKLDEIKGIELDGPSFTTKVDTLVRHLLWLREADPGAKSIIFSQYSDFLEVLSHAFSRHRIGHSSFGAPRGIERFKNDPSVECFLLSARAHSSGLNLVNANHVFLCEPLLNTALELQAIARVDRIGQQHETTVWLYIVDGTVEESIYNLSVQRRMEHMGVGTASSSVSTAAAAATSASTTPPLPTTPPLQLSDVSLEAANTLELERSALARLMSKDRHLGETVPAADLWTCLFGHVARREEREETRLAEPLVMRYLTGDAAEQRREQANFGSGAGSGSGRHGGESSQSRK